MTHELITIITSEDTAQRDRALDPFCDAANVNQLIEAATALDQFRRMAGNLYHKVRATFFLAAIFRYHLPKKLPAGARGLIPYEGYTRLLDRRFEEAVDLFLADMHRIGPGDALFSALASGYHSLGFQTLADQVRRSVRSVRGNQWMFRMGHPSDHPLRVRQELFDRRSSDEPFPILVERTPVRMDLSHSGWSDIFFLGMDYPEGARVLNVSIDLGVRGRDAQAQPPVEVYLRVVDEPVLRLASVDLKCAADIVSLPEVFDFAKDYLGLLKAGVIASGIIPPGLEGSGQLLGDVLGRLIAPGMGLEVVSKVNDIPKGSRLAVSTNLLAAIIAACMRATGQIGSLVGSLQESERKLVAARAILGEWLGGSGGGWQDSGGVWPGIKLIEGRAAADGDPEFGISRGRLLPDYHVYSDDEVSAATRQSLRDSFVLVHGGMAQNVGPVLEMVTEKYLLRSEPEWAARQKAMHILKTIDQVLRLGNVQQLAQATSNNFFGPIQTIIPWASNHYTETLIAAVQEKFKADYWGFLMLGGISGGGMGFAFEPQRRSEAADFLQETMLQTKRGLQKAMPFAMDPVVYDFAINDRGTTATLDRGAEAFMPAGYYSIYGPRWLRQDIRQLSTSVQHEIEQFAAAFRSNPRLAGSTEMVLGALFPRPSAEQRSQQTLKTLLDENGFDAELHEQIRADLRSGRIGLAQNRLPSSTVIEDVSDGDVFDTFRGRRDAADYKMGAAALAAGEVAVLALAAGAGTRWTQGAGVVKALHPFARFGGKYRNFIEVHLAKGRKTAEQFGAAVPYVIATSYLTHKPIADFLFTDSDRKESRIAYPGPIMLSPGRSVGLRMIPMPRDLRFAWEDMPQQTLDVQSQKVRDSARLSLIAWAEAAGGGADYTDNVPLQCLHPTGHWFELPNMLRNGTLAALLEERPQLNFLMLHNIDTLGASVDPAILGRHIRQEACLTFEVISRRIEDRGGGLARVNGRTRLVEGLAMPREEDEFRLRYYNSQTTWIDIELLLDAFGLARSDLRDEAKVTAAVRRFSGRLPTYITLKEVKKRWGHGQEDIFPVTQFEKLWSDMAAVPELDCHFAVVSRARGQQLKDPSQLDVWLRDGTAAYVDGLCSW
jgi:hypothetical protein